METNSLQWFGFKGEGLMVVLFIMGAVLHFTNTLFPVGLATMGVAILFVIIDIGITLDEKANKAKRGY